MPAARLLYRSSARARAIVETVVAELSDAIKTARVYVIGREGAVALWPRDAPDLPAAACSALSSWRSRGPRSVTSAAKPYVVDDFASNVVVLVQALSSEEYQCAIVVYELS